MNVVIGIDGGGTNTRASAYAVASDGSLGELVSQARSGPCSIAAMQVDQALHSVEDAIAQLGVTAASITSVCAAVAGFSFRSRRDEFAIRLNAILPNARVWIVPDYVAAFRASLPEGRGILVVAGTGSVAYAEDASRGTQHRAGAYGYVIDAGGSGYGVGQEGLAAVFHQLDGTGGATSLAQRIPQALQLPLDWDTLIEAVYGGAVDRVRVASLATAVVASARDDGDEIARRILMRAGGALAQLAVAVHARAFDSDDFAPVKIARAGSLWGAGTDLTDVFERSCLRFAPLVEFIESINEPVYGAAVLAAGNL